MFMVSVLGHMACLRALLADCVPIVFQFPTALVVSRTFVSFRQVLSKRALSLQSF